MPRASETVSNGAGAIETYVDGAGPAGVLLPSYGRDGGEDFDALTAAFVAAGHRVPRAQPRGIAGSSGPIEDVILTDLDDDVGRVIDHPGDGCAVVLGHAFSNFVARNLATNHLTRSRS